MSVSKEMREAANVLHEIAQVYEDHPAYHWLLPEDQPDKIGKLIAFEIRSTAETIEWLADRLESSLNCPPATGAHGETAESQGLQDEQAGGPGTLPICDNPECTREDHLIGALRERAERPQTKGEIECALGHGRMRGLIVCPELRGKVDSLEHETKVLQEALRMAVEEDLCESYLFAAWENLK